MPKRIVLYLVSHASGELVEMMARNAVAQLADVTIERTLWKFVRSLEQLPAILGTIAQQPGFALHTVAAIDVRHALEEGCRQLRVPCMFVLEPVVSELAQHFEATVQYRPSAGDIIDEEYFRRVEAMKFTLAHDDGTAADNLADADVVLVGVSRATKTPTCMYLASRGIKAANVPLVPGVPLPEALSRPNTLLVVGLTVDPSRLANVRRARLKALAENRETDYANFDEIGNEVREARRLFLRRGWPVIDVSNKSIEQTASLIIAMLAKRSPPPPADAAP
ncbi:MAG: pyruvate, water dikinase regulatory protein [Defluviicoccus sp.]